MAHAHSTQVKGVTSNVPVAPVGSVPAVEGGKSSMTGMMPPPPRGSKRSGDGHRGDGGADYADESDGSDRRKERKRQRKEERDRQAVVLDEIAPKETGRQAILVSAHLFLICATPLKRAGASFRHDPDRIRALGTALCLTLPKSVMNSMRNADFCRGPPENSST